MRIQQNCIAIPSCTTHSLWRPDLILLWLVHCDEAPVNSSELVSDSVQRNLGLSIRLYHDQQARTSEQTRPSWDTLPAGGLWLPQHRKEGEIILNHSAGPRGHPTVRAWAYVGSPSQPLSCLPLFSEVPKALVLSSLLVICSFPWEREGVGVGVNRFNRWGYREWIKQDPTV